MRILSQPLVLFFGPPSMLLCKLNVCIYYVSEKDLRKVSNQREERVPESMKDLGFDTESSIIPKNDRVLNKKQRIFDFFW